MRDRVEACGLDLLGRQPGIGLDDGFHRLALPQELGEQVDRRPRAFDAGLAALHVRDGRDERYRPAMVGEPFTQPPPDGRGFEPEVRQGFGGTRSGLTHQRFENPPPSGDRQEIGETRLQRDARRPVQSHIAATADLPHRLVRQLLVDDAVDLLDREAGDGAHLIRRQQLRTGHGARSENHP